MTEFLSKMHSSIGSGEKIVIPLLTFMAFCNLIIILGVFGVIG